MEQSASSRAAPEYKLPQIRFWLEDILFCVDVDAETQVEMKATVPKGQPQSRLDAIKQAIMLFVHTKLSINPAHRFAFSVLDRSFAWIRREFTDKADIAHAAVHSIRPSDSPYGVADLTQLFKVAQIEARKSNSEGRLFRVVLFYCRSSTIPHHQWPVSQKLFTLDVIYLHDKPSQANCPQHVYDALVDALDHVSEHEAYIFESGQGLTRVLFKHACTLLSHPHQRCSQDFLAVPRPLSRPADEPAVARSDPPKSTPSLKL